MSEGYTEYRCGGCDLKFYGDKAAYEVHCAQYHQENQKRKNLLDEVHEKMREMTGLSAIMKDAPPVGSIRYYGTLSTSAPGFNGQLVPIDKDTYQSWKETKPTAVAPAKSMTDMMNDVLKQVYSPAVERRYTDLYGNPISSTGERFFGDERGRLVKTITGLLDDLEKQATWHGSCRECIVHGPNDCPHRGNAKSLKQTIITELQTFLETWEGVEDDGDDYDD